MRDDECGYGRAFEGCGDDEDGADAFEANAFGAPADVDAPSLHRVR